MDGASLTYSYFPGCSLASTAKENNASLMAVFRQMGIHLAELDDWNCCGSSSAHSIDPELALWLPTRNLALAAPDRPLLVACPSCLLHLRQAKRHLDEDPAARRRYRSWWGRPYAPELEIVHVFDALARRQTLDDILPQHGPLEGLKVAPYYGCMLARPPALRHEADRTGLMEAIIRKTGAGALSWGFSARCCGTFLTAARPDIVTPMVNAIAAGAAACGADCIVTACAMCHLNLESRCTLPDPVPILHFTELLAWSTGMEHAAELERWMSRHIIDPRPLLQRFPPHSGARPGRS
jgi:heterodisulfide reductase subunit B